MRTVGLQVMVLVLGMGCGATPPSQAPAPPPPPQAGSAAPPAPPAPVASVTERWAASIAAGASIIDFVVAFEGTGGTWTATLEGVTKTPLPLAHVTLTADHIGFTLEKQVASEVYDLRRNGDVAEGTSTIGAAQVPARMVKLADGEAPHSAYARPQTPVGPFPYVTREVEIAAPGGGTLAGTLTLPQAGGRVASVLLWSGSGQQDRDETIFGHKPFLILADRLTRAGFATLRLDDRGAGKTTAAVGTLYTEITDASAAIDFLKKQKELDPQRVGMIAHSTGGMVAPNAARMNRLAFIVSLAGVAIPGRELALLQGDIAAQKAGITVPPENRALQKALGEAAIKSPAAVRQVLTDAVTRQYQAAAGRAPTPEELEAAIARPLAEATNPWAVSYFQIDPRDSWKRLTVPTLLVVGDLDTQVPADVTIAALRKAHGKKSALTTHKVAGLNHLFQHATTGLTDEYLRIEETFDPATLELIARWLVDRAK